MAKNFICNVCKRHYNNRNSFIRHYRKTHEKILLNTSYTCNDCHKTCRYRTSFIRHYRYLHQGVKRPSISQTYICICCYAKFTHPRSLARHKYFAHEQIEKDIFECATCNKKFGRKDNLVRHLQQCHCPKPLESYVCALCYKSFPRKSTLQHHIRRHMCANKKLPRPILGSMKCVFCEDSFSSVNYIVDHIMQCHDIQILHHHLKFISKDKFDEWKSNMQKSTVTFFRKRDVKQYTQESVIQFICHRSGSYDVMASKRKKRLKYQGTKKLGGFCPASIHLRINNTTGSCKVCYVSTHLGHNVHDKKELVHIPKEERTHVDAKISFEIPTLEIYVDNTLESQETEKDPQYYLRECDSLNISSDYKIRQTPDLLPKNISTNVEAFINRHAKSVLYYKGQNEIDVNYKNLHPHDIVIVIMTRFQEEMLIKYSHKVIAVDGTYNLNCYEFFLLTFLVMDNCHEGIPVAFIISNRNDEVLMKVALESIKNKVGILCPITFMSDIQLSYVNSWEKIMGPVQFHLFCNWHIFEAFRKNLIKIKSADKRKYMSRRVYELAMCVNEKTFESQLEELLENPDPDLKIFLSYFKIHYSPNTKSWAYCYCKHGFINTNTHCEAFNRNLKYFSGKLFKNTSLSDCLKLLDLYLNTEEPSLERRAIKGRVSSKLKMLRSKHDTFAKELEAENIHVQVRCGSIEEGGGWDVCIFEGNCNVANVYHVSKCDNYCGTENCKLYCEKCDACQYSYQCTCLDNMIKHNMCKHIHALCTTLKSQAKTLTIQKTADANAESLQFSASHIQLYAHASDDLQTYINDDRDDEKFQTYVDTDLDYDELQDYVEDVPQALNDINRCKILGAKQKAHKIFTECFNSITTLAEAKILYNTIKPLLNQIEEQRHLTTRSLCKSMKTSSSG